MRIRPIHAAWTASLAVLLFAPAASLFGQETSTDSKPNLPETGAERRDPAGFDAELFRRLLDGLPGEKQPEGNPLQRAIEHMRTAQERIEGQDTGTGTRDIQQEAVRELEKLIELARQHQQSKSQQASRSPQPRPERANGEPDSQAAGDPQAQNGAGQRRKDDKAADSTEQSGKPDEVTVELERRRDLVKEVWGHLPPAVREKLLQTYGDKYLPRYEDLVRRYFEALAEQGRQNGSR